MPGIIGRDLGNHVPQLYSVIGQTIHGMWN
jgi:hypothetical protein